MKKSIKIIVLLLLFAGITTSTYAQEVQPGQEEISKYTKRRDPFLAAGLSLITIGFGGGQYYNKEYVKGIIMSAISAGTIIWLVSLDGGLDELGDAIVGSLIFLANWAYSVIDAPISAAVINKRHGLSKVSFSPSLERNKWQANTVNVGLKLTLNLD